MESSVGDELPASPRSSVASSEDGERCRICYEVGGFGEDELVRPCSCSGSMEYIHKGCLLRWLTSSPAIVSRGCDVCDSPWREELVSKPSLRLFASNLVFGKLGETALVRFLRHVGNIPRFSDETPEIVEDDSDDDENDAAGPQQQQAGFGLDDAWEAIGLLAPAGGGVEELHCAAAAIVRLGIWSTALCLAVAQGRASLKLFAYGVQAVLVLDSRVDAIFLPGSVADYFEDLFPGLPCMQRAARFLRDDNQQKDLLHPPIRPWWGKLFGFISPARRRRQTQQRNQMKNALEQSRTGEKDSSALSLVTFWWRRRRRRQRLGLESTIAGGTDLVALPLSSRSRRPWLLWKVWNLLCVPTQLARGPWRVDDVFVGFVALALDVRALARYARNNRLFHRNHQSLWKKCVVALTRIATSPEAVAHDVATVFEHLVSSPLLVVHWLCVFPSYVYALRLALARMGILSADERVLDLENGEGVAFHLSLLAVAASATTCFAALAHSLHAEYVTWTAEHSLASLRVVTSSATSTARTRA